MRRSRGIGGIAVLALVLSGACRGRVENPDMPDWQYEIARKPERWLQDPAVVLLRDYVRIDTSNPPGREKAGADFLKSYLDCQGIPSRLVCPESDRCNLYARLAGRDHDRAVLLLNHIDVVNAYAAAWTKPPFGGDIETSYLYGRGAYDMKSTGIAQLLAFVDLWHSGLPLTRDVIFLAECGEETYGTGGVPWIYEKQPELLTGVNLVLNEGGYEEMVAGRLRFLGLEVGQTGFASALIASDDDKALTPTPSATFRGLGLHVEPQALVRRYLREVAEFRAPYFAQAFRNPDLLKDPEVRKWIPSQNLSLVTGGVLWLPPFPAGIVSAFDYGKKWNAPVAVSVPVGLEPRPYLDQVLESFRRRGGEPNDIYCGPPGAVSPYPTKDTEAILRVLSAVYPGTPVIPMVNSFVESTSSEFRSRGIPAYGFEPFRIDPMDAARRHANDERIFLPFYLRGIPIMREVLMELATS